MTKTPTPREALEQITAGTGIYGLQAAEYRAIARAALPAAIQQEKDLSALVEALKYISENAENGDMGLVEFVAREALAQYKERSE